MVWTCYKERGIGSSKKGNENKCTGEKKERERLKKSWLDAIENGVRTAGVCESDGEDQV